MAILSHHTILELHAAIISAQLVASRSALLAGLDPRFVAGLPIAPTLSDQILADLDSMNQTGTLADGSVPLATCLQNAMARAAGKPEEAVFRDALARCRPGAARPAAAAPSPPTPAASKAAPSATRGPKPIDVFFSYSHQDEPLRDELATHIKLLERSGIIRSWHDRRIGAGQDWKRAIDVNLERAEIILLLVSADFLASDYCFDVEMKRALEKREAGEALVIPVILRECDWSNAPFSNLQALPKGAKPVKTWSNRDEAWKDVALGIRAAVERFRKGGAG